MFQIQSSVVEGLTNSSSSSSSSPSMTRNNKSNKGNAGGASSYVASLKSKVVQLQDELLVSKYRTDYEKAIIQLDDYIGFLMIQQSLNVSIDGNEKNTIEQLNNLNILKNAKDSINSTMAFLDKQ